MEINLLILGTIFILTLFSVGENITGYFKLNKYVFLAVLAIFIVGIFLPPINIFNVELYFDKTIFPFVVSFLMLFKVKKLGRFFFSLLLCTFVTMLYSLGQFEVLDFAISPFILLAVVLGIFVGLNCVNVASSFSALFFGINIGNLIYYLAKFESVEGAFLEFNIFSAVFASWLVSSLIIYSKHRIMYNANAVKIDY